MPRYTLLHVKAPDFQPNPQAAVCFAGTVEARSAEDAFERSQGDRNRQWRARSTSVGDMIVTPEGQLLLVNHCGFLPVAS